MRRSIRDNHWSIKLVGRTRPQNIFRMEPVSNPSCLVWQPGRGRPTRPLSREPNNPYLTEREVRAQTKAQTSQVVRCTVQKSMRAAYPQNRHGTRVTSSASRENYSSRMSSVGSAFSCRFQLSRFPPTGHTTVQISTSGGRNVLCGATCTSIKRWR